MTDFRMKKTDDVIRKSFVDLVIENGFDNVTVSDIALRSMISRKTFYLHYEDKFALTDAILQDILTWLDETLKKKLLLINQGIVLNNSISILEPELRQLMKCWSRPIKAIMTIPQAKMQLMDGLKDILANHLQVGLKHPESDLELNVIGGMMLGMIRYYLQTNDFPSSKEIQQLSDTLNLIFVT
ncbi:TetR/AcrR family transcriptional regulator [Companilactobacillus halodurans]|uniref:TetR family transcriptional regulator n=1 Tax=Companilactobacillus halodurans TaxID=2584183 RepID=A0A5P0ZSB4_9LACO|nr:TetR/AcrR family transcriptional regulator [Companilactobacillus halodurans]MQS76801.1 TetR family transcriptional regulator [Companilactobacillus halodurans]MQS96778.1 TetR family transcriptional regulator [Companilactobacillus halodurans]